MTLRPTDHPQVDMVILPPVRDLGDGFRVRRALPSPHRRMVGPFIFFDQMGPVALDAGHGLDVRPHPHIGLSTVTYLFEGEILHRDSLGSVQAIRPGAVNWMTAGSGIVHSERSGPEVRAAGGPLFGLQTWIALPRHLEETAPAFSHHPAETLPGGTIDGVGVTVVAGTLDGLVAPVRAASDLLYADLVMPAGTRYRLSAEHVERAAYVVDGAVAIAGQTGSFAAGELIVFKPGAEIMIEAERGARVMLAGGEPFAEPRHIFWNFVSHDPERIEQAKRDWRDNRFAHVPQEHDFIPLPEEPAPVRYP